MNRKLLFIFLVSFPLLSLKGQTLGNYSGAFTNIGHSIVRSPSVAPTNTAKMIVSTSHSFHGVLTADPSNGKVTIVDPRPVGNYTIKVRAFSAGGNSITKSFILHVNEPSCTVGGYIDSSTINTGLQQLNLAVGDFNNDGKQDIAAAHEGGNNTLSIRLGNGSGHFTGTTEVPVGSHPFNLAIGDFNGDGDEDIVVVNSGDNAITPLLGNGNGNFTPSPVQDVRWTPVSVAISDFNTDGIQDVVTANLNDSSVSMRIGDGNGFFYGGVDVPVGSYPNSVTVGDFNSDGKSDFATANSGDNTISVLFGSGLGTFSGAITVPVGDRPYSIVTADFNEDGKQDLATANYTGNSVSVRYGNGLGAFSGNTEVNVGTYPYNIIVGNFNSDDHLDFATANYFSNNVTIRFGDGLGNFSGNVSVSSGPYPTAVATGEFNGDSILDLAISSYQGNSFSIRLGVPGTAPVNSPTSNSPICEGESIHLNATGGVIYSWTGPNGFSSNASEALIPVSQLSDSGIYEVTITDSTGCIGSASANFIIHPSPVVTFELPVDSVCAGTSVQLLTGGSPANGYYSGTGVTSPNLFNPVVSGPGDFIITYTYSDNFDCADTAEDKIHVVICEGVNTIEEQSQFNFYPNPVSSNSHINIPPSVVDFNLSLYSSDGKLIKEWDQSDLIPNDFSFIESSGLYYLRLLSESYTGVIPVVKE